LTFKDIIDLISILRLGYSSTTSVREIKKLPLLEQSFEIFLPNFLLLTIKKIEASPNPVQRPLEQHLQGTSFFKELKKTTINNIS